MPEDKTTLTADASQYFDVLKRAGVAGDGLARSGERIGAGFLKGERVVETATRTITTGLLTANNAGEALAVTAESITRVLRLPLATGIAATAGVTGAIVLRKEFEKTEIAVQGLKKALQVPLAVQIGLSPEDIASRIDNITKSTEALIQRSKTGGEAIARFFASAASFGMQTSAGRAAEQQGLIAAGEKRASELAGARADKELQISNLKRKELTADKDIIELEKARLDLETRRSKLVDEFISKGGSVLTFYKRLLAAQIDINAAVQKEVAARKEAAAAAATNRAKAGAENIRKTDVGFAKEILANEIQDRAERATARVEADALRRATEGRQRTTEEEGALRGFDRLANSREENALLREREALIRKQAQAEEILEVIQGSGTAGQRLGSEGNIKFEERARRLEEIDRHLKEVKDARKIAEEAEPVAQVDAFEKLSQAVDDAQSAMTRLNEAVGDTPDDFIRMSEGLQGLSTFDPTGVQTLSQLSFDNIEDLTRKDFSNLDVLSGLRIEIK